MCIQLLCPLQIFWGGLVCAEAIWWTGEPLVVARRCDKVAFGIYYLATYTVRRCCVEILAAPSPCSKRVINSANHHDYSERANASSIQPLLTTPPYSPSLSLSLGRYSELQEKWGEGGRRRGGWKARWLSVRLESDESLCGRCSDFVFGSPADEWSMKSHPNLDNNYLLLHYTFITRTACAANAWVFYIYTVHL